ncbi:MAG: hypothetical protein K6U89_06395 [Chloroflexi bacterium]|nr:hypothetical protein [Chloroflexota bacterium]
MRTVGVQHVVVGTSDLQAALQLYHQELGLACCQGPAPLSPAERALFGLPATIPAEAVTLGAPGQRYGLIRLVSFGEATTAPVRAAARPYDSSPKNLDFQVRDLAATYAALRVHGYQFRSEPVTYPHDGQRITEVQLLGPDAVNVVLIETEPAPALPFSPQGVAGVTQWVLTTGDLAGMTRLFHEGLGIPLVLRNRLAGPAIERMIGLPSGAALEIAILGGETAYGRIELVQYTGVVARDLTGRARPPAAGLLQVGFAVDDLEGTMKRLADFGFQLLCSPLACPDPWGQPGRAAALAQPDGLMIELWQRPPGEC